MSDKLQGGVLAGSTSISIPVILRKTVDNTENTGTLAASVAAYYWRQGGTPTALTSATDLAAITSSFAAGGWKAADATNQPGVYRLDVDNAAFASGVDWVVITVKVSGCYLFTQMFNLTTNIIQSGDSFAIVKSGGAGDNAAIKTKTDFLPSATAGAAGGLFIAGTNAATTITTALTTTFTGSLTGSVASVTGAVGSVTGAVGSVTGLTASDVGNIKTKTDFLPSATAGSSGGVFIAGTNAATTITTALTTTFTGNLTGSVASVTGAVGSVTGLTASDVGAIKTKTDYLPSATAGAAGGVLIAGVNATTQINGLTANITGNLSGSVGSVTGLTASNLDAAISTRLASASYTAPDNTSITAIKAKTDSLTFTTAAVLDCGVFYVNSVKVNGVGSSGNPWGP